MCIKMNSAKSAKTVTAPSTNQHRASPMGRFGLQVDFPFLGGWWCELLVQNVEGSVTMLSLFRFFV